MDAALCAVKVTAESACPIGKFEAQPVNLTLEEPRGVIGLREFARLVGVKLGSIQDAIDAGRITAVIKTRNGRKLIKDEALAQWDAVHCSGDAESFEEDTETNEHPTGMPGLFSPDGLPWGAQKTKEEAQLAAIRRELLQLDKAERDGQLHDAQDVDRVWDSIVSTFKARMLALPGKAAPLIKALGKPEVVPIQQLLESMVNEALAEVAQYDAGKIAIERQTRTAKTR